MNEKQLEAILKGLGYAVLFCAIMFVWLALDSYGMIEVQINPYQKY